MGSSTSASGFNLSPRSNVGKTALTTKAFYEGGHQLEKLEFALAISETRGDQIRSAVLRAKIADLGGNVEEPGT